MILGGGVMPFVDAQSALIVIFGTSPRRSPIRRCPTCGGLKSAVQAFFDKSSPKGTRPLIIHLAGKARKEGLVALEGEEIADPFMAGSSTRRRWSSQMTHHRDAQERAPAMKARHQRAQQIFKFMSATALPWA